jgi:aminopeptidase N
MPLMKAENQAYIHYFKGGLVMYAITDGIGKKTFHQALRNLLAEFKFQSTPPYPTTLDLVRHIKAIANEEDYQLIDDLFKKITLLNLKAVSATAKKLTNGNYQIELIVEAEKFYADGKGQETQAELDQPLDIGFFIKKPTDKSFTDEDIIKIVSKRINHQKTKLTYEVKTKPNYAGIEPYLKMIDRNRDDNLVELKSNN